jgi:hypothetical protein
VSDNKPADARLLNQLHAVNFTCPHCRAFTQHVRQDAQQISFELKSFVAPSGVRVSETAHHRIMRCVGCSKDTYFLVRVDPANSSFETLHQYPLPMMAIDDRLPENIRGAVLEAEKCLAIGAPNACGVMCRRAIHVLCADKNAVGKDLHEQLRDLKDRHEITPDLWVWSEELRVVGKHGAHPEWEDVTIEDADYAMRFLGEILRYVYVNPAERNARKMKETSTKK